MIDLVIVEDHPAIAKALAVLIDAEPDIGVVGVAHGLDDGDALIRELEPQVVLCDVMLAGRDDGFELLRRFGRQSHFVILTAYDYQAHHATAVAAGAAGYLSKLCDAETIVRTIRRVATGEVAIPPPVCHDRHRFDGPRLTGFDWPGDLLRAVPPRVFPGRVAPRCRGRPGDVTARRSAAGPV